MYLLITADTTLALTASADQTVKLWDTDTCECLKTFSGHTDEVLCMALIPDYDAFVSGSWDKLLLVYFDIFDEDDLLPPLVLRGHTDAVSCVAVASNGRFVVSGSYDNTLLMFPLSLPNPQCPAVSILGSSDSVESSSHSLPLIKSASSTIISSPHIPATAKFLGHTMRISCVAISSDCQRIYSGAGLSIRCHDVATAQQLSLFQSVNGPFLSFAFTGSLLASSTLDTRISLWDTQTGSVARSLSGHSSTVSSLAATPAGHFLVSGGYDGTLRMWEPASGTVVASFNSNPGKNVHAVAVSEDGNVVACDSRNHEVCLWDSRTPQNSQPFSVLKGHTNNVYSILFV
jgi:WD40 repeat protein